MGVPVVPVSAQPTSLALSLKTRAPNTNIPDRVHIDAIRQTPTLIRAPSPPIGLESAPKIAKEGKRAFAAHFQVLAGTLRARASMSFAHASFPRTPAAFLPRSLFPRLASGCAARFHLPSPSKTRDRIPAPWCCAK